MRDAGRISQYDHSTAGVSGRSMCCAIMSRKGFDSNHTSHATDQRRHSSNNTIHRIPYTGMYDEANLRSLRRRVRGAVGECPVWPQTTYTLDGATTSVQDDQMGEIGYWPKPCDFYTTLCTRVVCFGVDFDTGRFDDASRSCLGMLAIAVSDQVRRLPKVVRNSKSKICGS